MTVLSMTETNLAVAVAAVGDDVPLPQTAARAEVQTWSWGSGHWEVGSHSGDVGNDRTTES